MGITKTVIDSIEEKQLIWCGHVQIMSEERLPKNVMTLTENGKWGIPKKYLIGSIKKLINVRGLRQTATTGA